MAGGADPDADLLEVTTARLEALYAAGRYTPTQVTHWYLDRIARYDNTYRAFIHVDAPGALATAAALERGAPARGTATPLWGVPVIIKSNTSVRGLVTSAGWSGYLIPGRELVAPRDAPIVARLRAAGAIILGQANMPDFAASDANVSTAYGRTGNAYGPRFSPGGSSGGVVTALAANCCVLGNGTDTGNSIRMPSGTSAVVGLFPTRGLVSIAGIHPLDWLRDNTGPIARTVTDVALGLDVMAGPDPEDARTRDVPADAQRGPYRRYLRADALRGRRFGVPAFVLSGHTKSGPWDADLAMYPETRAAFTRALDALRAAGATVVIDDALLPDSFPKLVATIQTEPYLAEGVEHFLRDYGPPAYHSTAEYAQVVGAPFPAQMRGAGPDGALLPDRRREIETDPQAEAAFWAPRRRALAAYAEALDRFHLDGLVYPSAQMPPNDELADLRAGRPTEGPHSATAWVNPLGVPALVVPGGFYPNGLPFGLEFSARLWRDGDLLGWGYAYEQATHARRPPALAERR